MTVPGSSARSSATLGKTPPEEAHHGNTAVYRFFDAHGVLLYVGITKHLGKRFRQHSHSSKWWPDATHHSVEWLPTRTLAGRAERAAIRDEKPLHNVMYTPRACIPIAERSSRERMTEARGDSLLQDLEKHFKGRFFTVADARSVSSLCSSSVAKNIQALETRGAIFPVGTRNAVPAKGSRKTSTLYTLPVHEWLDGATGQPIPEASIPEIQPQRRRRKPAPIVKQIPVQDEPRAIPNQRTPLPESVSFSSGAKLLVDLGLVNTITADGIRYIARSAAGWPFGEGRPYPYVGVGSARTMQTTPFLDFFRTGPRRGGQGRKITRGAAR